MFCSKRRSPSRTSKPFTVFAAKCNTRGVVQDKHHGPISIEPYFQHYPWGDRHFIPDLYGMEPGNLPYAEAWLGAHERFPSPAHRDGKKIPLSELIGRNPERILGKRCH